MTTMRLIGTRTLKSEHSASREPGVGLVIGVPLPRRSYGRGRARETGKGGTSDVARASPGDYAA